MIKNIVLTSIIAVISSFTFSLSAYAGQDDAIKKKIIEASINNYSGNCPCPYNLDRAGRRCGKRSAYSKPGGYSPICYDSDVSEQMVERYKRENQQ